MLHAVILPTEPCRAGFFRTGKRFDTGVNAIMSRHMTLRMLATLIRSLGEHVPDVVNSRPQVAHGNRFRAAEDVTTRFGDGARGACDRS